MGEHGRLGVGDTDNRGDEEGQMGDNLMIVPIWYTANPTTYPTTEPTTKCSPYQNCTDCARLNSGGLPQCFWHISDETCYHYNELDHNESVIYQEEECKTSNSSADSLDDGAFQWILLSIVIGMICIIAVVVIILLRRRDQLMKAKIEKQSLEMSEPGKSSVIPPPDQGHQEHEISVSLGSRGEGMEKDDGKTTTTGQDNEFESCDC